MATTLVALLASVLLTPTAGIAQTPPANRAPDGPRRLVAIERSAETIRQATRRESVRLAALAAAARQQQQPPPKRSWPGRHPVLFGTIVGVGAGLAIEAAVIPGASGGEPHSVYVPMFATFGAGIGALTGLIVSAVRR